MPSCSYSNASHTRMPGMRISHQVGSITLNYVFMRCFIVFFFRSLVKLNLSYNQIHDLSGFCHMHGSGYKLSHLEIHGNRVDSIEHVTDCLTGCLNLRHLVLSLGGADNPVCTQKGWCFCMTCTDAVESFLKPRKWHCSAHAVAEEG